MTSQEVEALAARVKNSEQAIAALLERYAILEALCKQALARDAKLSVADVVALLEAAMRANRG